MRTSTRYRLLERCLEDIKNQTYRDWIILLINDGGDKNKIEELVNKAHLEREECKLFHLQANQGLHKAINVGARATETVYVVVHDDDDTWHPMFLEKTIGYLEGHLACKGLITHSNKVFEKITDTGIKIKRIRPFNDRLRGVISMYDMLKNNLFSPISFIYRSEIYKEIGYFNEALQMLEDWEFNIRFLEHYDIEILEEKLANYHIRVKDKTIEQSYRNTVTSKKKLHQKYDTIIRNTYLRRDLKNDEIGVGVLMNIIKWSDSKAVSWIKKVTKRA